MVLKSEYEYSHREIAAILGISIPTVQRIEKEAMAKIARVWKHEMR